MKLGQKLKGMRRSRGAKMIGKGLKLGVKIATTAAKVGILYQAVTNPTTKDKGIEAGKAIDAAAGKYSARNDRKLRQVGIVEDAEVGRDQNSGFPADSFGGGFSDDDMHEGFG